MGKLTFCKVPNEEGTKFYNIKAEWFDQEFSIAILDNASAWKGVVDGSEIEQFSKEHNTSVEEYIKECQFAFSSDGPEKFVYAMRNQRRVEETVIILNWKKIVDSDIKLKHGSVCLRAVPLDSFINDVWNVLDKMSEELAYAKRAMEQVECEKEMLFDRIREYQELKLEMEKTLYAKFIMILNTKKQKIEELEARLSENMCARTSGVDAPEDTVKIEPAVSKATVSKGRKKTAQSHGKGRTREKSAATKKAAEVISPLDILPPSQSRPKVDLGRGENNYKREYDSDTDVDEPAGPSTSRSNIGGGKVLAETKVKSELPEPGTSMEKLEEITSVTNAGKTIYEIDTIEEGSPPRKRESGSSTDIDDFLAQEDHLSLSMMPKRSRRSTKTSGGNVPCKSRGAPPVATKVKAPVFNTQDLLDDL